MVYGIGTGAHKGTQKKIPVDIVQGFFFLNISICLPCISEAIPLYGDNHHLNYYSSSAFAVQSTLYFFSQKWQCFCLQYLRNFN